MILCSRALGQVVTVLLWPALIVVNTSGFFNDMFMFDLNTMSWTVVGTSTATPTPRYSFGFTSADGKLWAFGGLGFNGEYQHQSALCSIGCLRAVYHSSRSCPDHSFNTFRSHACSDAGFPLNDLYVYNTKSRRWTDTTNLVQGQPPSPRFGLGFAAVGERLFVFGGTSITFGNISKKLYFIYLFVFSLKTPIQNISTTFSSLRLPICLGHKLSTRKDMLLPQGMDMLFCQLRTRSTCLDTKALKVSLHWHSRPS